MLHIQVGLEINPVELPDAGVYSIKLVNPLGEDVSEGNINVRKVYSAPTFSQKFTDLQQVRNNYWEKARFIAVARWYWCV